MFLVFTVCFSVLLMDLWRPWHLHERNDSPFVWDVAHYYSYLPATFNFDYSFEFHNGFDGYLVPGPKGGQLPKTTYGMAILYAPFYALGYKIATNQHNPLDGYSEPFATCVHWGSIFYGLLGLFFLRNLLVHFFSEAVTTVTLAVIFFGTNLFYYVLAQSEMTHGHLFMLFAALLLATNKWYEKITWGRSLLIGFLIGLISLIRPTEVLIVILFVFWRTGTKSEIAERFRLLLRSWPHLLLMAFVVLIIWLPQMLLWKARTDSYLYFSYPGERFFWGDPQIVNILLSYRKGWFVYTPLMLLAFAGLFFLPRQLKPMRFWITGLILLNIYMLSCWWDWFFGGSFGARGFVQHYAYLSLPLAGFTSFVLERMKDIAIKPILQFLFVVIICSGICLNIGQSYQYNQGMIHFMGMNKKAYWLVFGKYKLSGEENAKYWKIIRPPNYEKLRTGENRNQ